MDEEEVDEAACPDDEDVADDDADGDEELDDEADGGIGG